MSYGKVHDVFWDDEKIAELVAKILRALPPADPLPFPVPRPRGHSVPPQRKWASRKLIWEKTGGRCAYCHKELDRHFEIDHVIPRFKGGPDRTVNLLPCCYPCNVEKGGGLPRVHI